MSRSDAVMWTRRTCARHCSVDYGRCLHLCEFLVTCISVCVMCRGLLVWIDIERGDIVHVFTGDYFYIYRVSHIFGNH